MDAGAKMPTLGSGGDVTAVQLAGKPFDDPMWEALLDRISFDEMQYFLRVDGYRTSAIPGITFNATGDQDGPCGHLRHADRRRHLDGRVQGAADRGAARRVGLCGLGAVRLHRQRRVQELRVHLRRALRGQRSAAEHQRGLFLPGRREKNPTVVNLMREATHRVLYSAINSAGIMIWGGLLCRGARPCAASI